MRLFIVLSVLIHVGFFVALAGSETLQRWVFGSPDAAAREIPPSPDALRAAARTMLEEYTKRFAATAGELVLIRDELAGIDREKLERLRTADTTRERLITAGAYPSAENPDPTATFAPLADIDPEPVTLDPVPPLPGPQEPRQWGLDELESRLVELYRLHPLLDEGTRRLYERYQALEMAEFPDEPIPLSRTIPLTRMDPITRPDINPAPLSGSISTKPELQALQAELIASWHQTQEMLRESRRRLARARGVEADLATLFGNEYERLPPPPEPYQGQYLDPKLLRPVTLEPLMDYQPRLGNAIGGREGLVASQWVSLNHWWIIGPFAHPGRDRRLEDLERVYPPEAQVRTGVDLDATYRVPSRKPGAGDLAVRWKYREFSRFRDDGSEFYEAGRKILPYSVDDLDYGLWYFYTLVYSDVDQTVLASFNSDDYGKCWVNGEAVYESPPTTRPFAVFTRDSFVRVTLKKGVNQVLFKLENAQGTTGFSAMLMTYEDPEMLALPEQLRGGN